MSIKINAIIVEDQEKSSAYLMRLLELNFPEIKVLSLETTISNAKKNIDILKPDLVFLDIHLTDGLSFEILEQVSYQEFETIFTTGYDGYYQKAFEYCAFNYLLKPINPEQLRLVIEKYKKLTHISDLKEKKLKLNAFLDQTDPKIMINLGDTSIFVALKDIIVCKANGSYCEITIKNKAHLTSKPLKYYEELLMGKNFFKANRSTLVNVSHVTSIHKKETLSLSNKERVNVSVRNRNALTELMSYFS